ncbi:MAG: peptidylprolyl isomerase [Dysgonomonas sp.]
MATLQKIRNKGGLLVVVLGVALLAFILGDLFTSGNTLFNKFRDKAFIVDGEVVSTGDYQNRITEFEEFQKFMSGRKSLDPEMSEQLREEVYRQMVKEKMLDEECGKLGITVTSDEMTEMVYGENVSSLLAQMFTDPNTRQLNREALIGFVNFVQTDINSVPDEQKLQLLNMKQQWIVIQNLMKYGRLEEKYNALIFSSLSTNDLEAKSYYDDSKYSTNVAYVVNRYSNIPDSTVSVSDKEIEKLYNERKNNFKLPTDLRKVSYIVKDVVPSESDYKDVEDQMKSVYDKMLTTNNPALLVSDYSEVPYQDVFFSEASLDANQKNFAQTASVGDVLAPVRENEAFYLYKLVDKTTAPDSVKVRAIMYPQGEDIAAANNRADSIINVVNAGKTFVQVATELNYQPNGGEIGWIMEPSVASEGEDFVRKCFTSPKGSILRFEDKGMIRLIYIEDVTRPVQKVKLAVVRMSVEPSDKTIYDIDNEMNQFVAEYGNAANFVKGATEKGYNLMPEMMLRPSSTGLPQVQGSRQIIHWAFNEKVGSVKKFDLNNYRVVALIDEDIKAGYAPISEVSDMLKAEIINDKKAEKMISDMKSKNIGTLDGYAQALGSKVDTVNYVMFTSSNLMGVGREPIFNVVAAHSEVNKVEGPLKGSSGVYVLSAVNRTEDAAEYNAQMVKQNLNFSYMYRLNSDVLFGVLTEKLKVEDNRVKFF